MRFSEPKGDVRLITDQLEWVYFVGGAGELFMVFIVWIGSRVEDDFVVDEAHQFTQN